MSEMNNFEYFEQERNAEEQKAFEQELAQNDELRNEYRAYQALTIAIKRIGWKQDIQSAQKQHNVYRTVIKAVIAIVALTLIAGVTYVLTNQSGENYGDVEIIQGEKTAEVSEPEIPSEVDLTRIESETFSFVGNQDNILETNKGALISIPEGTLVDEGGHVVEGEMTMTLTEIYDAIEILKTGLSTESNGKPLETGGMFEFKVEQDGKPIKVKDGKKIVFDIPSNTPRGNMSLFEGEYMEDGSVNWVNPTPITNYLTKVDIESLNFYPEGFEQKVLELGFENPSKKILDSLFYSFYCEDNEQTEVVSDSIFVEEDLMMHVAYDLKSDYKNLTKRIKDELPVFFQAHSELVEERSVQGCGIEPAMIKTIWSKKFQNTFIATQEFEERLKVLYESCDASLLQLYLDNLDKNMWEVDQMVVERSSGSVKMRFEHFVDEKKTNIEDVDQAYRQLNAYYLKQSHTYLKAIRKTADTYWAKQRELDRKGAKRKQKKQEQSAKAAREQYRKEFEHNLKSVYKQLGIKPTSARALRARGRRRSYQVEVTNTGIYNIDRFVTEMTTNRTSGEFSKNGKTAKIIYKPIEVTVAGKDTFDFVNVYVQTNFLPSFVKIKSQTEVYNYQLNNDFHYQLAVIAQKGEQLYMYSSDLAGGGKYQVTLAPFDEREKPDFFSAALAREVDYSRFILEEEKRQKERARVLEIQSALRPIIFPCSPRVKVLESMNSNEEDVFEEEVIWDEPEEELEKYPYADYLPEPQEYAFTNEEGREIELDAGIKLNVNPYTFNCQPGETVKLFIASYVDMSDILYAGISTMANNKQLESAGMFFVEAKNEKGENLDVLFGSALEFVFPNPDLKSGFMAFAGEKGMNGQNDSTVYWSEAKAATVKTGKGGFKQAPSSDYLGDMGAFDDGNLSIDNNRQLMKDTKTEKDASRLYAFYDAFENQKSKVEFSMVLKPQKNGKVNDVEINVNKGKFDEGIEKEVLKTISKVRWRKGKTTVQIKGKFEKRSKVSNQQLDHITLKFSKTGWVNCDRYYRVPRERKRELYVTTDKDASVRMVFKNFKSVIPGRYTGAKGFYFGEIPYREKYTILAYKVVGDEVAVATRLSDDDKPLVYKRMTAVEFKQFLKTI